MAEPDFGACEVRFLLPDIRLERSECTARTGVPSLILGRFLGGVRRETPGLRKCGFHQNSTPASAISTRYRVGLGGVAFVPPGAICALLRGAGAV